MSSVGAWDRRNDREAQRPPGYLVGIKRMVETGTSLLEDDRTQPTCKILTV